VEAVGKDLIDNRALCPIRGGEIRRCAGQLPAVAGFHIGVVSLLEQPEGTFRLVNAEIIEIQAWFIYLKTAGKNVVGAFGPALCKSCNKAVSAVVKVHDAFHFHGFNGAGNVDIERAKFPLGQCSEGGFVFCFLRVKQNPHRSLLV